jgi:AraC family transcriptional regulator
MASRPISAELRSRRAPLSSIPYDHFRESGFLLRLVSHPAGVVEVDAYRHTTVSVHFGPSVDIAYRGGGSRHRGRSVHGDVFVIPANTPTVWEMKGRDTALAIGVSPELMNSVAEQSGLDPARVEIRTRFQVRDAQLESVAWALKAEIECGYPSGRLYLDSLAISIAARLVRSHSSASPDPGMRNGRVPGRRLKNVLAYIEENLARDVSLAELASVANLSATHFKSLFRESAGLPVHQYVIRRRVERARSLLGETELPISQIALETGFAHQSHLARHMRRVLGVSPKELREALR